MNTDYFNLRNASVCQTALPFVNLLFPDDIPVFAEFLGIIFGFNVAKTLLGLSSVFVSVPPPTVKLLLLLDSSVTEFPFLRIFYIRFITRPNRRNHRINMKSTYIIRKIILIKKST